MGSHGGSWSGTLHIGNGVALLDARVGERTTHRHLAIQLSVGVDGPIELSCRDHELVASAVLIGGNIPHRIGPLGRHLRSLYVEPQLLLGKELAQQLGAHDAAEAGTALEKMAREWKFLDATAGPDRKRARELVSLIETAGPAEGPRDWARALGIAPSRLRAFCVEVFGAPPVRLRQWLRLKAAARVIAGGGGLAEAAALAGYADQPHFTRQLSSWFGVSPGRGLSPLRIVVE
ncbi:MAG: helix-turn-helix domain-containing protein [Polyangiaceae bacterium]|nr:helix-turn-helix domain-containing protein [Polyangiaceae bacterium]